MQGCRTAGAGCTTLPTEATPLSEGAYLKPSLGGGGAGGLGHGLPFLHTIQTKDVHPGATSPSSSTCVGACAGVGTCSGRVPNGLRISEFTQNSEFFRIFLLLLSEF